MTSSLRQKVAAAAELIVVKVGTRVLTRPDGMLNEPRIAHLAEELHQILDAGHKVVLVSSGAVGAGMGALGLTQRPRDLDHLQAVAAVGQSRLVETYDRSLRAYGRHAAQVLLTADDLDDRTRYLNVRNTLRTILEYGAVPIINENDTVSVEELQTTFGDNDRLAAMVTNLIRAPLLVLLSDVEGLYDGDPHSDGARLIPIITKLDDATMALARDRKTGLSKGGMASKLAAARMATLAGENVIIASGRQPGTLARILAGEEAGTLFVAQGQTIPSWKRWIGFTAQPRGGLVLDDGARRAIEKQGRSLLAIGVIDVVGEFQKGDVVALRDAAGCEFARGLTNYASAEIARIKGLKTDAIAAALGHCPYQEVIHRDNMAVTTGFRVQGSGFSGAG
ncbi:MAG TPA: glutamate 5-kinase [Pirellulales bacterium]|nr:glutamate 5-kinase [Pirellulales bacterium]